MSTSSKIDVFCPECKARLAVPVAALGKSGKCPHCQNVFPLAMPAPRPAAPAHAAHSSPLTPLSPAPASPLTPLSAAPYPSAPLAANVLDPLGGPDLLSLPGGGLTPLPAGNPYAPQGGGNPFAAPPPPDEYALQPAAPAPYSPSMTLPSNASIAREQLAMASASYEESKQRKYYSGDGDGWGINAGIGGGALMMLLAVVWFVLGLMANRFYPYPLFMFVVGVIAFFKGIADNFSE